MVLAYTLGVRGHSLLAAGGGPQSRHRGTTLEIDRPGEFVGGFAGALGDAAVGLAAAQACSHGQDTSKQPDSYGSHCDGKQRSHPALALMVFTAYIGLAPEIFRRRTRE